MQTGKDNTCYNEHVYTRVDEKCKWVKIAFVLKGHKYYKAFKNKKK